MDKLSVVIATYNSEKTLEKVLKALRNQDYPKEYMEILLVDGGSTDATFDIGKKYGCSIINNPRTEPVYAKLLGAQAASGKYMMILDHDEVLINRSSVSARIKLLQQNNDCKVAFCSGYKRPADYPLLNQYISEFGDPFSLYMYNFSKDYKFYEKALKSACDILEDTDEYMKVSFGNLRKNVIIELCCLATIIDLDYFKNRIKICESGERLVQCFYYMLDDGCYNALLTKCDPLEHYSVDSLKAYFPKIKWRIMNNVHFVEQSKSGFSGRQKHQKWTIFKKYTFIIYSLVIPVSLIHSLYLFATRKNVIYLLHPILCLYVTFEIVLQYMLKIFGYVPSFKSYDGKKIISKNES